MSDTPTVTNVVNNQPAKGWHLSKEIPITLVVALALQFGAGIWYTSYTVGNMDSRLTHLEKSMVEQRTYMDGRFELGKARFDRLESDREKVIRLEEKITAMGDMLKEVRDALRDGHKIP